MIDYLEKTGQLENTVVFYGADNGASGEGSPNGSVNENKFFNGYPDESSENIKYLDVLGGPDTYEHFPTGWAVAFSTPFQMFKRYSTTPAEPTDPLVISWPKGIKARGEVRTSTTIRSISSRRSSRSSASRCRRYIEAWSSFRSPVSRCATASMPRPMLRRRRSASTTRCSALAGLGGRLARGACPRADHRQGTLRPGRMAALPRRRGPFGIERPRQAAPREAAGAHQGLVRGGQNEPGAAAGRSHRA